jgi:hypothetical protein
MMIPMKAIFMSSFIFLYAHILRDMQLHVSRIIIGKLFSFQIFYSLVYKDLLRHKRIIEKYFKK